MSRGIQMGPIWWLRGALSGVLFSLLFLYMGYTDPGFRTLGYGMAVVNLPIVVFLVWMYWNWPRSPNQRRGTD